MKIVLAMIAAAAVVNPIVARQQPSPTLWVDSFTVNPADVSTEGRNTHFILDPGYRRPRSRWIARRS